MQLYKQSLYGYLAAGVLIMIQIMPLPVAAVTSLSQGYTSVSPLSQGTLVSIKDNQSGSIEAADSSNAKTLLGVVINSNSSLLTLSDGTNNQVQVATSGIVSTIVSDINGPIHQGDTITSSPISGVGMKTTSNAKVIGIAQGDATADQKQSYTDAQGKRQTASFGNVDVLVNVAYFYKQPEKTLIPSAIQNVANAVAGKSVSSAPIIICGVIFLVTLVIVSSIIYSMIRSSIISVGRNPMSQSAVYRDVIQLSLLVLGILVVAVVSIYFVLTRF